MNLLDVNDTFVLETGKFMHKLQHNQLPQVFQELFKINHTVYTIPTRNKRLQSKMEERKTVSVLPTTK